MEMTTLIPEEAAADDDLFLRGQSAAVLHFLTQSQGRSHEPPYGMGHNLIQQGRQDAAVDYILPTLELPDQLQAGLGALICLGVSHRHF